MSFTVGTLSKAGDKVKFTGSAGQAANFAGCSGTFTGLKLQFAAAPNGNDFSPINAKAVSGGGGASLWAPADNSATMYNFDDVPSGASVRVSCVAIASGSATIGIGNRGQWGDQQTVTYAASMTPDASQCSVFTIAPSDTVAFTVANPVNGTAGQEITFIVTNSSGGTQGAITWGNAYKLAGSFTNPANTKSRTITFRYDGTSWWEICRAAADI